MKIVEHPPLPDSKTVDAAATTSEINTARRVWMQKALMGAAGLGALSLLGTSPKTAWAAGSDAPEKTEVTIGFIPLTDCASVVMASVLGFDKKYGIKIIPRKEASWASVRDKLVNGDLDMAHVLYGLIYGVHLGTAGPQKDMAVLMNLSHNGQGITLSKQLRDAGVADGESLRDHMRRENRGYTFAETFPTGTHAMWLHYWLAGHGINPVKEAKVITVPPPQMVANMRVGNMDGYCVGEPWNARAITDNIGFSAATSQEIWTDHPEKVLGSRSDFVRQYPNTARAVIAAVLEASRWIDSSAENIRKTAETIAAKSYVNTSVNHIVGRMLGQYDNGLGKSWSDPHSMRFHSDGAVNYPYLSDGMWFLTQHKRWGLLASHPDYEAVSRQVNQIDLYRQGAALAGVPLPSSDMRSSTLFDGVVWNGQNPAAYADGFTINAGT